MPHASSLAGAANNPGAGAAGSSALRPAVARRWRVTLLLPAGLALLLGMASGLARLGVPGGLGPVAAHGPLLALGFLGTLIALERAVAVGHRWAYLAPAASGAGALAIVAGLHVAAAGALLTLAGVGLAAVYAYALRLQPSLHLGVMTLAALAWPLTAALWTAGWRPARLVSLLAAFLVLTIVGERLELSRLGRPSRTARSQLLAAVGLFAAGALLSLWSTPAGWSLAGAGLTGQALWLARHDVARRTVRLAGLPRYAAVCLLAGYAWLAAGGVLWMAHALAPAAFTYAAAVHAVFLGFVMSMVFGHAPIILPAVLRIALPLHRLHYLPVAVLHTTLLARVLADLAGWSALRALAGIGNTAAIVAFVIVSVAAAGRPSPAGVSARRPMRPS